MGQAPWPARDALVPLLQWIQSIAIPKRPTRGSTADVGVRPTIYADARKLQKLCGIRQSCLQAAFQAAVEPERILSGFVSCGCQALTRIVKNRTPLVLICRNLSSVKSSEAQK